MSEYLKFRIKSNSQLLLDLIRNQSSYSKCSNNYLNVIYTRKRLCVSKKLKEYNSLPTTQTTNRVPQNCCKYLTSTYYW